MRRGEELRVATPAVGERPGAALIPAYVEFRCDCESHAAPAALCDLPPLRYNASVAAAARRG
jgi:hypothetical protein